MLWEKKTCPKIIIKHSELRCCLFPSVCFSFRFDKQIWKFLPWMPRLLLSVFQLKISSISLAVQKEYEIYECNSFECHSLWFFLPTSVTIRWSYGNSYYLFIYSCTAFYTAPALIYLQWVYCMFSWACFFSSCTKWILNIIKLNANEKDNNKNMNLKKKNMSAMKAATVRWALLSSHHC